MSKKMTEVDTYLQKLDPERRTALERLRSLVFEVVPDATETMKYRMPTYERGGNMVCAFASQKRHLSLYMDTRSVEEHKEELKGLSTGKSCIRFKSLEELPLDTVEAMLKETVQRNLSPPHTSAGHQET